MATETQIANLAAMRCMSTTRITSLDDNRPLAIRLKAIWDIERRATLRDGSFNFAARRGTLGQLVVTSTAEVYPYMSAFELPAECLRLIEILHDSVRKDYRLEGRRVLCNVNGPLYARWITDVTEPAEWGDAFADAFAWRLARNVGPGSYGEGFDAAAAERQYQMAIVRAKGVDAKEDPPQSQEESDWILARLGQQV